MSDPITIAVATTLAAGATKAVSDGVRALVTKLASLVRERFRRNPSDEEVLESAFRTSGDPTNVQQLAEALGRHMRDDPAFDRSIRALWSEIAAAEAGGRDNVTNVVGGPVHGSLVQARDVQGGITFHASPPPPGNTGAP